jgi:thymidylate synthase (FAD)
MLDPARQGLARELARMNLTLNTYTQWYWKTDLHNLLHFLRLRADAHAQYEIRAYAEVMLCIIKAWVPNTYAAFQDYRLGAATFSAGMLAVLRRMLAGEQVDQKGSGMSKREWTEMMAALGRDS